MLFFMPVLCVEMCYSNEAVHLQVCGFVYKFSERKSKYEENHIVGVSFDYADRYTADECIGR